MYLFAKYILSTYSFISNSTTQEILDVGYLSKDGNPIPSFDENVLIKLCEDARQIFEKEDNVLELDGDFIIVGDIHGSLHDLLRILKFLEENDSKVLFLGDFVDRGNFSLECITILFALKTLEPTKYYLIRGNHEFDSLCSQYGFKDEILNYHNPKKSKNPNTQDKIQDPNLPKQHFEGEMTKQKIETNDNNFKIIEDDDEYYSNHKDMFCYKYTIKLYEAFIKTFAYLPICAIINKTNFAIHGGLSPRLQRIDQLRSQIQRPINLFEESLLLTDVVWSDPSSGFNTMFCDNPRGRGYFFNRDSVYNFLNVNSLNRIIRAHQCVKHGSRTNFKEKCVTVFSASSYSNEFCNKSGVLKLCEKDDQLKFFSFPPLPRLEKSDAIYYKVEPFNFEENKEDNDSGHHACFSFRHPNLPTMNFSCRKVVGYQSARPKKPYFRTFSKKVVPLIINPNIKHSTSLDNLNSQNKKNIEIKGMVRSNFSLDNLDEFAENM